MLTAVLDDASGYGRVVRALSSGARDNAVEKIVEDKDAYPDERLVREVNVGSYVVDGEFLFPALERLDPRNAQGEYYLTDIVQRAEQERRWPPCVCRPSMKDWGLIVAHNWRKRNRCSGNGFVTGGWKPA